MFCQGGSCLIHLSQVIPGLLWYGEGAILHRSSPPNWKLGFSLQQGVAATVEVDKLLLLLPNYRPTRRAGKALSTAGAAPPAGYCAPRLLRAVRTIVEGEPSL